MNKQTAPPRKNGKTAIALCIPTDEKNLAQLRNNISSLKNAELCYTGEAGVSGAWRALKEVQADQYLFLFSTDTAKLGNWINQYQGQSGITIAETKGKGRFASEWLSGFSGGELNCPWLMLSPEVLLSEEPAFAKDKFSLLYSLQKTDHAFHVLETDAKDATETSVINGFIAKVKTSLSWYNPLRKPFGWRTGFSLLAIVLFFAMSIMSRDAGISGDEFTQHRYSDSVIEYFTKGNPAALYQPKTLMHLYGSSFDTFANIIVRLMGTDLLYETRHMLNGMFGWLAILFGALIIRKLTGSWKYGFIGLALLFLTPRFIGESFNNPKDPPFATGYMMALYYMLLCYGNFERQRVSHAMGLILGIALAISIRIGGLILIPMVVMYAGLNYIGHIGWKNFISLKWTGAGKILMNVAAVSALGYFIGLIPWPYGLQSPLENPFKALSAFSNYQGSLRQLFEGKMYDSDLLPSNYLTRYLLITTPIVTLAGIALYFVMRAKEFRKFTTAEFLMVFAMVFPVFYIWYKKSNVYGGLRHVLFVIPCAVVIGTVGWKMLESALSKISWSKIAVPLLTAGLAALPASYIAKNHPYEYIYFNETVGGVKGAYGRFEMDYYLSSLKQSSEWLIDYLKKNEPGKKVTILTYGMDHVKYYFRNYPDAKVGFTRYDERGELDWDYAIFYNAYMDKDRLLNGSYPPKGTIYTPMADGKPMGLVLKRLSKEDLLGYKALKAKDFRAAVTHYTAYLKFDDASPEVYKNLSEAYGGLNQIDSAIAMAEKSVSFSGEYTTGYYKLVEFYLNKQKPDKALEMCEKIIEVRPKDAPAYFYQGYAFAQKNMLDAAIEKVNEAILLNNMAGDFYNLGAQLYAAKGDKNRAQLYAQAVSDNNAKAQIIQDLGGVTGEEEQP